MNDDDLKLQQWQAIWTTMNLHERVSSRWHARCQGFVFPYLHLVKQDLNLQVVFVATS